MNAKTPLLESGTLGPKGHVQVIVPYKTESYGSQQDPQDEAEIPHCTLKMFPEEALHCVEWARDKFGKIFTQRPKGLNKFLEDEKIDESAAQEVKTFRESVSLLSKKPTTFDDCVRYARMKFQKYYVNDIRQLLYTYPLDSKTKEGRPFWSLPKRPPRELTFDPTNLLHASFIVAAACLRANIFNIPIPKDVRKDAMKLKIAEEAVKVKVADFKPSDEKASAIASEVSKTGEKKENEATQEEEDSNKPDEIEMLLKKYKDMTTELPKGKDGKVMLCLPEEFEKDNDANFHIDFIYASANCRAENYQLDKMDWITVKIKAGRIVPALATTTAAVAGLQTMELIKLLKKCKVEDMKSAFLSLAIPIMTLSEPGPPAITKLTDKLSVTIWDRWEVSMAKTSTLNDLFGHLEKVYELVPKDVAQGSKAIYLHAMMEIHGKEKEKEAKLKTKLLDLFEIEADEKYIDINVTMTKKNENDLLKGVPSIRIRFD